MSKDIFSLLSLMCEKIGPNAVMGKVVSVMANSKKPLQQKAVLQWLLTVLKEFGSSSIDVKIIVNYLQTPQVVSCSFCDGIGFGEQDIGREERFHRVVV